MMTTGLFQRLIEWFPRLVSFFPLAQESWTEAGLIRGRPIQSFGMQIVGEIQTTGYTLSGVSLVNISKLGVLAVDADAF